MLLELVAAKTADKDAMKPFMGVLAEIKALLCVLNFTICHFKKVVKPIQGELT